MPRVKKSSEKNRCSNIEASKHIDYALRQQEKTGNEMSENDNYNKETPNAW